MRERKRDIITIGCSILVIAFFMFGYALPDLELSVSERRHLAKAPKVSFSTIMSGDYMTDVENYLGDHIPGREMFKKMYSFAGQYVFAKKEVNGYVHRGDGIFRMEETLSPQRLERNVRYFRSIQEQYFPQNDCYYAIIPDKNFYLKKPCGYQRFAYEREREIVQSGLQGKYIDLWDCLTLDDYYRTDLHWRQECLNLVQRRILQNMGQPLSENIQYEKKLATNTFQGSYLLPSGFLEKPDTLFYLQNDILQQVKVYDYEKKEQIPVYMEERMETGDAYDIFLGGAKALLTIENKNSLSDKELILFRDSYGSSLAPLLVASYRKITLIDTRYTTPAYALSQISWDENTQILFLYQATILNGNAFR